MKAFDLEMARMVSGDPRAGERLDWLLRYTTMLRYDDCQRFHFWSGFRAFLLWEMEREYTEEKRKALFSRGGLYYELKEDYSQRAGMLHQRRRPFQGLRAAGAQCRTPPRHGSLCRDGKILPQPAGGGNSRLSLADAGHEHALALAMDYEGSERWYGELQAFAERCGRQDAAGKQARSRLAWLDISLPQRGVNGLTETIPAVFRLLMNKEVTLPSFSVTSALPSIMNGGKDFSAWSKKDDLLYKTLRLPVEAVLGRDGVGLADCAIAESKFEKGEDVAGRMLSLLPQLNEVRNRGTPDMEFAVSGLLARSQLASGQPADARRTIEVLRECFAERGLTRFLPNMDAMLCRIDMHTGDLDAADAWYREKSPAGADAPERHAALPVSHPGHGGAGGRQAGHGAADACPAGAVCPKLRPHHRRHSPECPDCHCPVPQEGRAVARAIDGGAGCGGGVPLHPHRQRIRHGSVAAAGGTGLGWRQKAWRKRIMAAVRTQAAFYPHFLEPRLAPGEELTPTELQILHLLCADKSNAEIAQIMDVKLPTVKTHVSHILDKLNVKRRAEAKTAAKKLRLIPDDL